MARRELQKIAGTAAADKVRNLVLLGPANYGTFSAAFAVGGTHGLLPTLRRYAVEPAGGFQPVMASMTGLYQLLPWDVQRVPWLAGNDLGSPAFWSPHVPIDADRLGRFFGWGRGVDSTAFDDRTTVILGDNAGVPTCGGATFRDGLLLPTADGLAGDGTVPHSCAVLPGAAAYLAPGTEHSRLPMYRSVIAAIRDVLAGRRPNLPVASSNPGDHVQPQPLTPASFAPIPFAGPTAGTAVENLLRVAQLVQAAAAESGLRVRVTVEADPRS